MIRPTSLLRSDSERPTQFSTPVVAINKESIDCGIVNLIPCCLPSWFHRFATPKTFISFLSKLAIVQGAFQAFFAITLSTALTFYEFPHGFGEWIAVSHDLFMGFFALLIAHYGYRYHRPVWIGALACIQGVACILVYFPYKEYTKIHGDYGGLDPKGLNLCNGGVQPHDVTKLELVTEEESNGWITIGIFLILQLITGLANASFFSHGFSYLDDNTEKHSAPVYFSILIAVRMCSTQIGAFIAWYFLNPSHMWGSAYWLFGGLLIKCGIIIILFPKQLLTSIMKRTVANIVETVRTGSSDTVEEIEEDTKYLGFMPSFMRVLTNKIIVINTLSSVFMYMALDNFVYYEGKYMEAQYFLPQVGEGFQDPWTSRLVKNIARIPTVTLCVIISGLVVSKFQPNARKLAIWNVIVSAIVSIVIFCLLLLNCEKAPMVGQYRTHLINPYCSKHCNCDYLTNTKFEPVCTQDGANTYYSPCHAGCSDHYYINNLKFYSNCSCSFGTFEALATPGACNNDQCASSWMIFQSLSIVGSALIATGFVGNLLITIRSVLPSDKSMAIAFELALAGILVHVPGKNIYGAIAGATCQYITKDGLGCSLHNAKFGPSITILSGCLLVASAIMDAILVLFVKDLNIYDDENGANDDTQMRPIARDDSQRPITDEPRPEEENLIATRRSIDPNSRPGVEGEHLVTRASIETGINGFNSGPSSSSERPESDPPRYSDIETRRPLRPKPPKLASRVSSDDEPLSDTTDTSSPVRKSMTPRSRDGLPMANEDQQRDVINEFRQKQGTLV